jgi:hypothetical protein
MKNSRQGAMTPRRSKMERSKAGTTFFECFFEVTIVCLAFLGVLGVLGG